MDHEPDIDSEFIAGEISVLPPRECVNLKSTWGRISDLLVHTPTSYKDAELSKLYGRLLNITGISCLLGVGVATISKHENLTDNEIVGLIIDVALEIFAVLIGNECIKKRETIFERRLRTC